MGGIIAVVKVVTTFLGNNITKILTGAAIVGVGATAVMAAKDHERATLAVDERKIEHSDAGYDEGLSKKELFFTAAPCYWRTALIGAGTIGCIVAAEVLNATTIAGMTAAGVIAKKELEDKEEDIKKLLGNKDGIVADPNGIDTSLLPGEGKTYCIDAATGFPFWCSIERLRTVETELNRLFLNGHTWVSLRSFYEMVGLPIKNNDSAGLFGWDSRDTADIQMEITFDNVRYQGEEIPAAVIRFNDLRLKDCPGQVEPVFVKALLRI